VASRVGAVFARNGGVATTPELRQLGFSEARIRSLVESGLLITYHRGVYVLGKLAASVAGDIPGEHALHLASALAASGAPCAGSHATAATIHGLDILDRPSGDLVFLTHPRRSGSRAARPGIRLHAAELRQGDVVKRHSVSITSVARTVVDLARAGTFREGVVVADSALHTSKTTHAELQAVVAACPQWPGIQRARRVLDFSDERAESPLESLSRVIMHERKLPPPELQARITNGYGAEIARVDFFWPQYRTIGEADGAMKYQNPAAARKQLERDKKLRAAGYELVHFGWQGIVYETDQVVGEFRTAFGRGRT
jgi:hypothetical protein